MRRILTLLLPAQADNTIREMKLPVYLFTLIAIVSTVRSLHSSVGSRRRSRQHCRNGSVRRWFRWHCLCLRTVG
jgi:hypothetical protein